MISRTHRLRFAMLVLVAACQSDDARPNADATERNERPTPTRNTGQNAAGTSSAANSGGGPLTPAPAGAPAAPVAGTVPTEPGTPPVETPSAAESCELPDQYTRAARVTLALTWPDTLALVTGTGTLVVWAKVTYTRSSDGSLVLDSRPCGLISPTSTTTTLAGGLKMSVQIPPTAFDSPSMPTDRTTVTVREDRSLELAFGTVLGAMLPDPNGAWPSSASLVPFDHDGDGSPGITFLPLEGPEYVGVPTSVAQTELLDRVYIASRARLRVSVTPACSGVAEGKVQPLSFDQSVVGCHVKDRDDCNTTELRFVSTQSPRFMLGASGTWSETEVPSDASCADVRAALPPS